MNPTNPTPPATPASAPAATPTQIATPLTTAAPQVLEKHEGGVDAPVAKAPPVPGADTAIDHKLEPHVMADDAPMTPKQVTLHRGDAAAFAQNQSVILHAEHQPGTGSVAPLGETVEHALASARVPAGYTVKHPKTGKPMGYTEDLYDLVKNGDTVEVVKA